jgi:hypothetical protein
MYLGAGSICPRIRHIVAPVGQRIAVGGEGGLIVFLAFPSCAEHVPRVVESGGQRLWHAHK